MSDNDEFPWGRVSGITEIPELVDIAQRVHPEDPILGVIANTDPKTLDLALSVSEGKNELLQLLVDFKNDFLVNIYLPSRESWGQFFQEMDALRAESYRKMAESEVYRKNPEKVEKLLTAYQEHLLNSLDPNRESPWDEPIKRAQESINELKLGQQVNEGEIAIAASISDKRQKLGMPARLGVLMGSLALILLPASVMLTDYNKLEAIEYAISQQDNSTTPNEAAKLATQQEIYRSIMGYDLSLFGLTALTGAFLNIVPARPLSKKLARRRAQRKLSRLERA